jgi:hypothetical protein
MKYFVDGGPAQQVTQFQPTFSQQGIGSLQQAPNIPAMEGSPTDYSAAPTQQYTPTTSYSAPAAMTAGLGSYMEGLQYKAPAPMVYTAGAVGAPDDTTSPSIYDPVTQTYKPNPRYVAPAVTPSNRRVDTTGGSGSEGGSPGEGVGDFGGYGGMSGDQSGLGATSVGAIGSMGLGEGDYGATSGDTTGVGAIGPSGLGSGDYGATSGDDYDNYADGGSVPQGIASLGRGQDSMLVHMTPGEVQGLQRLAMAHGGSLTINPQTGLPEAGFLSSLLPMIAGIGLNMAFPGSGALIGAGIGGLTALTSGSLSKGLMAGLGAYGGASLGGSLASMGAEQAQGLAATDLANATDLATSSTGNASADMALKRAQQANIDSLVNQATANPNAAMAPEAYRDFLTNQAPSTIAPPAPEQIQGFQRDAMQQLMQNPQLNPATQQALARGPVGNAFEGFKQLGSKEGIKNLGGKLGYAGVAGLAAPLISSALTPAPFTPPAKIPTQYAHYGDSTNPGYRPPKYNPLTGDYDPASYGPVSYSTNPTQYGAEGGVVGYKQGGIADFYPLTGDRPNTGGLGGAAEKPRYSREINDPDSGAGINNDKAGEGPYSDSGGIYENTPSKKRFKKTSADTLALYLNSNDPTDIAEALAETRRRANAPKSYRAVSAAQGGLMGTYAAGGKLLRGPGDGMSDSIPAVIQGANPQRAALADGEFVIPADVVSHLGNGSTEAGSKRLYSMMDKVRKARTGNPKQGKQINPDRFMPA